VTTKCNHTFCYLCLEELMEMSTNEDSFKCPMCRSNFDKTFKLVINKDQENMIKSSFPNEYAHRLKAIEQLKKTRKNQIRIKLLYGNKHELILDPKESRSNSECQNKHRWTVFVEASNVETKDIIQKVVFGLHPTFGCTKIEVKHNPYELVRVGWGTFDIPIKIYFRKFMKREPLEINHYLSFSGNGETKVNILKIDKQILVDNKINLI
jgi:hypothetical protein